MKITNVIIGVLLVALVFVIVATSLVILNDKPATQIKEDTIPLTKEQIFVIWENGYLKGCLNPKYNDSIYKSDSLQLNKILYGNNF